MLTCNAECFNNYFIASYKNVNMSRGLELDILNGSETAMKYTLWSSYLDMGLNRFIG